MSSFWECLKFTDDEGEDLEPSEVQHLLDEMTRTGKQIIQIMKLIFPSSNIIPWFYTLCFDCPYFYKKVYENYGLLSFLFFPPLCFFFFIDYLLSFILFQIGVGPAVSNCQSGELLLRTLFGCLLFNLMPSCRSAPPIDHCSFSLSLFPFSVVFFPLYYFPFSYFS